MNARDEGAMAVLHTVVGKDGRTIRSLASRFASKVRPNPETGCWVWTAATSKGYGIITVNYERGTMLAHRLSYLMHVGPVPDGLELDHLCRNRSCVNPEHLEAVTGSVNTQRGSRGDLFVAPTHCPHGHDYAIHGRRPPSSLAIICGACKADYQRQWRRHRSEGKAGGT